jgi:hypothetical protein
MGQPSQIPPMGKTVKAIINILTSSKGLKKSVCCEDGVSVHHFALAPATCSSSGRNIFGDAVHKRRIIKPCNIMYILYV